MLYEFIELNRGEIISRCRAKVAARTFPPPSETEINHGVPLFLDQLVDLLRSGDPSTGEIDRSAGQHGHDLRLKGFTVSQVVHDYGDVCQTITGLALEKNAPISTNDFRTLNRCLDEAIASAVTMFTSESEAHPSTATGRDSERVKYLVHEIRNLVNTAVVAFGVLKTGNVGLGGSTGAVLDRALDGLRDLIGRSLEDVRSTKLVNERKRVLVSDFIAEIGAAAALEADARGLELGRLTRIGRSGN